MRTHFYLVTAVLLVYSITVNAHEISNPKKQKTNQRIASGCGNPGARADLDLGNVRAMILTGGDMWWDLASHAQYEVPKQTDPAKKRTAMFAGELWMGGYDANNQLHLAAQTYRQTGNDFWPGPLDTSQASTTPDQCLKYDKIWKLNRSDVYSFAKQGGTATADMLNWPGNGDMSIGQSHYLAPFFDKDGDGVYNPAKGDYPNFDVSGNTYSICDKNKLPGDQVLWWVINDNGNIHSESHGAAIGVEIQATAFVINNINSEALENTTFYRYKIINRGGLTLSSTYFGVFADPDLGWYKDDYVGCDVKLGLGYCYNGAPFDKGGGVGYNDPPFDNSMPPPAIGLDFLEGPFADANGIDDPVSSDKTQSGVGYGDGIIDNERIGMSTFLYFNNTNDPVNGSPNITSDYYNYLKGHWKNGPSMTYGGNAIGGTDSTHYIFPDSSDIKQGRNFWDEVTAGNSPDDRRFVMSAGTFTLKPGAVNYITYAVIWAQAKSGNPRSSIAALKTADNAIQALFNNCTVTVGIANNPLQKVAVSVFPNPFSAQTQVYIDAAIASKPIKLKVFDITGKCVRVYDNIASGYLILERGELKSGMYMYSIENNNAALAQGKIIIE